jgi:hypothetical protein
MIQHMHINKINTSHQQNERQKPNDHLNRAKKACDKIQYPSMIKAIKE